MLREHYDAVEADLALHYGIDLADLWARRLSVRRLIVLVEALPSGSAVWAVTNDVPYGWTLTDILVADLFHAMTGTAHPARPKGASSSRSSSPQALQAALLAQRARTRGHSPPT